MAFDKEVMRVVCRAQGHSIVSLRVEEALTPKGDAVASYKVLCTQCGGSLEEIGQEIRAGRSGKTRQRKPKGEDAPSSALSDPPPPISGDPTEDL
jgi:hypothetical protein